MRLDEALKIVLHTAKVRYAEHPAATHAAFPKAEKIVADKIHSLNKKNAWRKDPGREYMRAALKGMFCSAPCPGSFVDGTCVLCGRMKFES